MTILRMMVKIPQLSNYPLESYSSGSISLHMSHHLLQKTSQCQRYAFIVVYRLPVAHSSSPLLPSLVRAIPSMDEPLVPPPVQAKARARLQRTRGLRRLTKQDGAQAKGEAWGRARQMGSVHGRSVQVLLVLVAQAYHVSRSAPARSRVIASAAQHRTLGLTTMM